MTIQETKFTKKNKIQVDDYAIFKNIRNKTAGGGIMIAVHKALQPINVSEDVEGEEILVVEATIDKWIWSPGR